MVPLQARLDQSPGDHFHLVEKRLVAPFLPLTVNLSSSNGDHMWMKTRSLSKEARHRNWLLGPCVLQCIKIVLQFCISHVQFRISITIFLVLANSAHHPPTHLTHFPLSAGQPLRSFCWSSGLWPAAPFRSKSHSYTRLSYYSCVDNLISSILDFLYFWLTWSGPLLASTRLDLADIIPAASSCKR